MFKLHKLQIINSLLLFFLVVFSGYGQSETVNFIWEDDKQKENQGSLLLEWKNNELLNCWSLHIDVTWYDTRGERITDSDTKPFIYISEYDLEIQANDVIKCLNFSISSNIYDLQFQDSGELRFELPSDTENPGTLDMAFKYFLSSEELALANINPITIPNRQKVSIALPDTRKQAVDLEGNKLAIGHDSTKLDRDYNTDSDCLLLREQLSGLVNSLDEFNRRFGQEGIELVQIRGEIGAIEPNDTVRKSELEKQLLDALLGVNTDKRNIDLIFAEIRGIRNIISTLPFPEDSVVRYQREVEELNLDFRSLSTECVQNRNLIGRLLGDLGSSYPDLFLANLRKELEQQYVEVFQEQLDSVQEIKSSYAQIEPDLLGELRKGPRKAVNNSVLEGFLLSHEELKARLGAVYDDHKEDYLKYRDGIEETDQILVLENIHLRVDEINRITASNMNNMDLKISRLEAAISDQSPRSFGRTLIIGGSILLFVVILFILIRRSGQKNKKAKASGLAGVLTKIPSEDGGFALLDDLMEQPAEYYKMLMPADNQDVMLTEVHFHIRVIKSVYHLIQAALMDKKPEDFGGLLFGRKYKANENGNSRHILIVERVVPATNIRHGMAAGKESGANLVDEIEKLVLKNKKLALLGWFASATEKDLEMPENLVKVHSTYFREKWQIACLVHPVSEKLDSAVFIRRKSGFFDTIPKDDCQLKWDDLYQFAINPPSKSKLEEKKKPNAAEYLKIKLNQNWCDSIVEKVYLHPSVLAEIGTEKENREQMVAGQIANGFFYGEVWTIRNDDLDQVAYEVFINKLTIVSNRENPRDLPGSDLLGWLKYDTNEIFESLKQAVAFHNEIFNLPYQLAVLINTQTDELRFFSRKHSREMNNNTIETEEFNLSSLIDEARAL